MKSMITNVANIKPYLLRLSQNIWYAETNRNIPNGTAISSFGIKNGSLDHSQNINGIIAKDIYIDLWIITTHLD